MWSRAAKAIMTVSENTKRDLVDMLSIPKDRITVTYPAVDHARFQQKDPASLAELKALGLPSDYLLYIGNLKEFKNVERLVKAYERLWSVRSDSPPLVLVGRNFIPGFDKTIGRVKGLHWLGEIRRELLPSLYQNALLFLFPSLYEGFGLPPLEAMASGTPVLCSNRASLPEVVGEAAVMIDPENIDEMAAAMRRLIDDRAGASRAQSAPARCVRARRVNSEKIVRGRHDGDGREIFFRIVRELVEPRVRGKRVGRHQQQIAVGCRLRHNLGADDAIRSRPVLDDDLLPHAFGHLLREGAGQRIRASCRGVGHNDAYRLRGITLLCRRFRRS